MGRRNETRLFANKGWCSIEWNTTYKATDMLLKICYIAEGDNIPEV